MLRKSHRSPDKLPQHAETWHVTIQQLRVWITPPDEDPWRPFIVLIPNLDKGVLQFLELLPDYPTPEQLLELLLRAMKEPPKGTKLKPHRPTRIQFEDAALAEALRPELEKVDIDMQQYPRFEEIDNIIADLEVGMRGGQDNPGLLSVKDVTPELAGGFFAAAAEFYRAAPWVHLTDQHTLAVRVSPEHQPRFGQVMGNAGIEYGLAVYRRWEDVKRVYDFVDDPLEILPPEGGHSCFFGNVSQVPFADLEAIEQYGWEIADKQAYPIPVIYPREGDARRPSAADLLWYEAAFRAIPIFARDHLQADSQGEVEDPFKYRPVETTFSVATHAGETEVHIKYPAGTLPKEMRPARMMFDWPDEKKDEDEDEEWPQFDRRAMEGTMAFFGTGFEDADLNQAQELMYQAWDERNPAKRIILAHEALSISPDCADAYVLLAEEEADTLGRALEYYQKGVEAGERALGKAYFEENEGHFWGLLETRPYMRAHHGLANTLWELGRTKESISHYWDMLRLNPGDNQGVRYVLLNLLLTLDRDAEAQALIEQYEDDAMAEWLYTRALLTFRAEGASEDAESILQEARHTNSHVPAYLTGRKRIPNRLPPYITWGGEDEAVTYAASYLPIWRRTPGAIDWLQSHLKPSPTPRRKSKRAKRRREQRRSSKK
jgi:tetratricopeptide (TPR) repeat protein